MYFKLLSQLLVRCLASSPIQVLLVHLEIRVRQAEQERKAVQDHQARMVSQATWDLPGQQGPEELVDHLEDQDLLAKEEDQVC